jgi:hypothetical protein
LCALWVGLVNWMDHGCYITSPGHATMYRIMTCTLVGQLLSNNASDELGDST